MSTKLLTLLLIFFLFSLFSAKDIYADTYYVAPDVKPDGTVFNDSSSTNTGTLQNPFVNFNSVWPKIARGDTLILLNGIYKETLMPQLPQQNPNNLQTIIRAESDGGVILDAETKRANAVNYLGYAPYFADRINLEGVITMNSTFNNVVVYTSNNNFKRISLYDAGDQDNSTNIIILGNYNLLEDCLIAGTGRKKINLSGATGGVNNTVRRCFAHTYYRNWVPSTCVNTYCGSPWPDGQNVEVYNSSNNIFENLISTGAGTAMYQIQANGDTAVASGNKLLGSVAYYGSLDPKTLTFQDYGPRPNNDTWPQDPNSYILPSTDFTGRDTYNGMYIFGQGTLSNNILKDVVMYKNAKLGFSFFRPYNAPGSVVSGNLLENATIITNNVVNFNFSNLGTLNNSGQAYTGSSYIGIQNSKIQGTTYQGTGAKIEKRYENGVLTNTPLWPWPMEQRANKEFATLLTKYHTWDPKLANFSITKEVCENILTRSDINAVSDSNGDKLECWNGVLMPTPTGPTPTPWPTATATTTPTPTMTPAPIVVPGAIEAENFNTKTGTFNVVADASASGGNKLGGINGGATASYTFSVAQQATYQISVRTSSAASSTEPRSLTASIDTTNVGTITPPITTAWNVYQNTLVGSVTINPGTHILTLTFNTGWFDIDSIIFSGNVPTSTPTPTSSIPCPDLIGNTKRPDANGIPDCDKQIDILDFTYLSSKFGTNDPGANLDGIGNVTILDFTVLANNFGKVL